MLYTVVLGNRSGHRTGQSQSWDEGERWSHVWANRKLPFFGAEDGGSIYLQNFGYLSTSTRGITAEKTNVYTTMRIPGCVSCLPTIHNHP
jgi:hypothetical protein